MSQTNIISYWAIFSICGCNGFTASSNYIQKHVDNSNQSVGYGTMNILCHPNIITEILTLENQGHFFIFFVLHKPFLSRVCAKGVDDSGEL